MLLWLATGKKDHVRDTLPGRRCTRVDVQTSWSQECSGTSHRVAPYSESAPKLRWLSFGPAVFWGPLPHDRWHQTWPSKNSAQSPCWGHQFQAGCGPFSRCASWRPPVSHWQSSLHSAPCGPLGHSSGTPEQAQERQSAEEGSVPWGWTLGKPERTRVNAVPPSARKHKPVPYIFSFYHQVSKIITSMPLSSLSEWYILFPNSVNALKHGVLPNSTEAIHFSRTYMPMIKWN